MKTRLFMGVFLFVAFVSSGFSQDPVKQYRNSLKSGTNINSGIPRTISAFYSVNDTNSLTYTTLSTTFSTNLGSGVFVPASSNHVVTLESTANFPISAMTVTVSYRTVQPIINVGSITVAKGNTSVIMGPPTPLGFFSVPSGFVPAVATPTFDDTSTTPMDAAGFGFRVFTNAFAGTVKLAGTDFSSFKGIDSGGTWSLGFKTVPVGTLSDGTPIPIGSNVLLSVSITLSGASSSATTANGTVINLTPRGISEENPTENGVSKKTRLESEQ